MKRKILLSAVFIVLAISCVFAEQYTAQVILNIQDDTKVAWTSEEYNGEKDLALHVFLGELYFTDGMEKY